MRLFIWLIYKAFILSLLIISIPVHVLVIVGITLTSGLPVYFRQKRIGFLGKPFMMYKFRTMIPDAHNMQHTFHHLNEAKGPVFKIRDDPRFTRFGEFLSHSGLDELPQLWNVFKGDMALFGPRPLPVSEAQKLKSWHKARHNVKPGIISPWILIGYHRTSFDNWMKSDISYGRKKSLEYDLVLLLDSVRFVSRLIIREVRNALADKN